MTLIRLTPEEIQFANELGARRNEHSRAAGRSPGRFRDQDAVAGADDAVGARCELAAWKWMDGLLPWITFNADSDFDKLPDLGERIDVKGKRRPFHKLLVPTYNLKDWWAYLSVLELAPDRHRIVGWLWGREVARHPVREPRQGRPCYAVDTTALRRPHTLLELVKRSRERHGTTHLEAPDRPVPSDPGHRRRVPDLRDSGRDHLQGIGRSGTRWESVGRGDVLSPGDRGSGSL